MSFSTKAVRIESIVKDIASKKQYNKATFLAKSTNLPELISARNEFADKSVVEKIIAHMAETDFCKITEVEDCVVGKYQSCTCTKVMVFGGDYVNGKRCEKFTARVTSSKCKDGNFALAGPCIVSPLADLCDAPLVSKDEMNEIRDQLTRAQDEIKAICSVTGACGKTYLASFGIDEL